MSLRHPPTAMDPEYYEILIPAESLRDRWRSRCRPVYPDYDEMDNPSRRFSMVSLILELESRRKPKSHPFCGSILSDLSEIEFHRDKHLPAFRSRYPGPR
ncbi:MAG: hypothetical protein MZU97_09855 [Bacillus subtilis]|nr:hypothetical protein [Bacillus subtilis]